MIAVDTSLLVYAYFEDLAEHQAARVALRSLHARRQRWAVPWPCVHEFVAVVTNPHRIQRPSTVADAWRAIDALTQNPGVDFLAEAGDHLPILRFLLDRPGVVGSRVHDARVAAICIGHGVSEIWTADRDFSRFPELRARNPLAS